MVLRTVVSRSFDVLAVLITGAWCASMVRLVFTLTTVPGRAISAALALYAGYRLVLLIRVLWASNWVRVGVAPDGG